MKAKKKVQEGDRIVVDDAPAVVVDVLSTQLTYLTDAGREGFVFYTDSYWSYEK